MRTKRIPHEESEHARRVLDRIVREEFKDNESAAARALGISQAGVHEFREGKRGAGLNVLRAIADHLNVGVDVVTGRAEPSPPPLNRHADWPRAREDAERLHPEIPPGYFDLVGRGHLPAEALEGGLDGPAVAGWARELAGLAARAAVKKRPADP